jgi:hypothetical protein
MGFLDPGKPIVTRLKAVLTAASLSTVDVLTAVDAGAILDEPLDVPCVYVLFDGYEPTRDVGAGIVQQIEQTWTAVVALRHVSGVSSGDGSPMHLVAAPILDAVLSGLCGWRPCAGFDGFQMAAGGGAVYSSGYGYFSLRFTTRTVIRGTP